MNPSMLAAVDVRIETGRGGWRVSLPVVKAEKNSVDERVTIEVIIKAMPDATLQEIATAAIERARTILTELTVQT